ncbi:TPA: fimbrial protein, partial [Escherichia coli]|nr:fimbrial protein [Escherichia coli]HAH3977493.1 fimbrial protein [Escherichia coli]HAI9838007.1 fimbrial protein [Escherichia coli]HAJ1924244.1 fimbrial protein [Escherichia coli]HAJ2231872.1 fimbrial protein [Escherichia coli]
MKNFCVLFVMYFWSTLLHAVSSEPFPP